MVDVVERMVPVVKRLVLLLAAHQAAQSKRLKSGEKPRLKARLFLCAEEGLFTLFMIGTYISAGIPIECSGNFMQAKFMSKALFISC